MALEHLDYFDPLERLLRKERRTCAGCIHQERKELFGTVIFVCKLKNRDGSGRKHGDRCKNYREK
ncbi:MAG: hypothetical protein AAFO57_00400 [Pseudomonadota bacterium]